VLDDLSIREFETNGVVVLRCFFDPGPLTEEIEKALTDGFGGRTPVNIGSAGNEFRYVPMMCDETPESLLLLEALVRPAAVLLGRETIPTRAKGTRYFGGTSWHRDSDLTIRSIGFAGYLDALDAGNGALRVMKGSHRSTTGDGLDDRLIGDPDTAGETIATQPGDIIALDERVWHSSTGGENRLQWRVDFVIDPVSAEEEAVVRAYFGRIFRPGWDGGYDVDRFPSFGERWRRSDRRWVDRLAELGVYEQADEEEAWVRTHRGEVPDSSC